MHTFAIVDMNVIIPCHLNKKSGGKRMRKLSTISIAVVMLAVSLPAAAQLSWEQCQQLARDNYPLLQRYDLIRQSTAYTLQNIRRGYLPQLSVSGQASYQSDATHFPDALGQLLAGSGEESPSMRKDQYKIALDLNQVVWDGGNLQAQKRLAGSEEEVQMAQTEVDMYALRNRVNELFFGILLLDEKLKWNGELQKLLQSNCRILESRKAHGTAMTSDINTVRAEYLKARQERTALVSMQKSYRQMLALFVGKDTADVVRLLKPAASLPQTLESHRPELHLFSARMQQIKSRESLLNAGIRPRISLFAQGYYGYPGYDMFESMFSHDLKLNGIAGIRLSWNIGRLYTLKADRRKLDIAREQIETERETFLFNNRLQSAQETEAIRQYEQMMKEDTEIIELRTAVRQASETQLTHGVIGVNDLLQEITRENQARISHATHEVEMLKKIYELKNTINQ